MNRVIAVWILFLVVLSTLVFAQDSDASAAAEKDISAAALGKCGFFCRMEKVLITGDKFKMP